MTRRLGVSTLIVRIGVDVGLMPKTDSIIVHLHSCKKTGKQNKRSRVSTVATSTNFVVRAWTLKPIFDIAINIFNVRMIINSLSVKLAICIVEPVSEVGDLWILSHHPSEVNFEPQL